MHSQYAYMKRRILSNYVQANGIAYKIISNYSTIRELVAGWKCYQRLFHAFLHKILYIIKQPDSWRRKKYNITSIIYLSIRIAFISQKDCLEMSIIGIDNFIFASILRLFYFVNLTFFQLLKFLLISCQTQRMGYQYMLDQTAVSLVGYQYSFLLNISR